MVRFCYNILMIGDKTQPERPLFIMKGPLGAPKRLGKSLEQLRAPWAFAICLKLLEPIFGCYIMWKEMLFNNLKLWTTVYFFIIFWENESVKIVLLIQFFVSHKLNMLIQIFFSHPTPFFPNVCLGVENNSL